MRLYEAKGAPHWQDRQSAYDCRDVEGVRHVLLSRSHYATERKVYTVVMRLVMLAGHLNAYFTSFLRKVHLRKCALCTGRLRCSMFSRAWARGCSVECSVHFFIAFSFLISLCPPRPLSLLFLFLLAPPLLTIPLVFFFLFPMAVGALPLGGRTTSDIHYADLHVPLLVMYIPPRGPRALLVHPLGVPNWGRRDIPPPPAPNSLYTHTQQFL